MGNAGRFMNELFVNIQGVFFTPYFIPPYVFNLLLPEIFGVNFFQGFARSVEEETLL